MDVNKLVQLKPEEEVLEIVREDLAPHMAKFILIGIWFILPFFFFFPLLRQGIFGTIFFLLLIGSATIVALREYIKWKNTALVVTDRRIIDIEQHGLFDRIFSEVTFAQVDEVSYRIKGFFPTVFRYGALVVKTTGNAADLEFIRLRGPSRLHDLINDLRETILDEERDRKKEHIEKMAKSMSMEEIKELEREVRKKEQVQAMSELFEEDEDEV